VPDQRPRGRAHTTDELVEELDRQQEDDEAAGSAPAPDPVELRASADHSPSFCSTAARSSTGARNQ